MSYSNVFIHLDGGHGGVTEEGRYTTAPDKMVIYDWNPVPGSPLIHEVDGKFHFYEGEFNRLITEGVAKLLTEMQIPFIRTYDQIKDTPLRARVNQERQIKAILDAFKNKRTLFISTHANAGGGKGIEVFTSRGQTYSDVVASYYIGVLAPMLELAGWDVPFRLDYFSDGDPDKEANFYVLKETTGPAILIEHGFMDNVDDLRMLCSPAVQDIFIRAQAITCLWLANQPLEFDPVVAASTEVIMPPRVDDLSKEP